MKLLYLLIILVFYGCGESNGTMSQEELQCQTARVCYGDGQGVKAVIHEKLYHIYKVYCNDDSEPYFISDSRPVQSCNLWEHPEDYQYTEDCPAVNIKKDLQDPKNEKICKLQRESNEN